MKPGDIFRIMFEDDTCDYTLLFVNISGYVILDEKNNTTFQIPFDDYEDNYVGSDNKIHVIDFRNLIPKKNGH